jgi:hypothetical protein
MFDRTSWKTIMLSIVRTSAASLVTLFILNGSLQAQEVAVVALRDISRIWNLETIGCEGDVICTVRLGLNNSLIVHNHDQAMLYIISADGVTPMDYDFTSLSDHWDFEVVDNGIVLFDLPSGSLYYYDFQTEELIALFPPEKRIRTCDPTPMFNPIRHFYRIGDHQIMICAPEADGLHVKVIDIQVQNTIYDVALGSSSFYGRHSAEQGFLYNVVVAGQDGHIYLADLRFDNPISKQLFPNRQPEDKDRIFIARYDLENGEWEGIEVSPEWFTTDIVFIELIGADQDSNLYFYNRGPVDSNEFYDEIIKLSISGDFIWLTTNQDFDAYGLTTHELVGEDIFFNRRMIYGRPQLTRVITTIAPTANAGTDQSLSLTTGSSASVTLNASSSRDADGSIPYYLWSENGTTFTNGLTAQVDLSVGVHTITLTVIDNMGASSTDEVVITVSRLE